MAKRAFKICYFFTPKRCFKKGTPTGAISSHLKIKSPIFCCSLFIKEYLNAQTGSIKWYTSIVSITILVLQVKPQGYTLLYFFYRALVLYFSPETLWNLCKTYISYHFWGIYSNLWRSDYWKMYFTSQKSQGRHFYWCVLEQLSHWVFMITCKTPYHLHNPLM